MMMPEPARLHQFDPFDEDELLAYIEGELSDAEAQSLGRRLQAHPEAARLMEQMRADRALLRSVELPALPQRLLASIEPHLARPMLMEPRRAGAAASGAELGAFRRSLRGGRGNRRRAVLIAALLLAALGAALWVVNGSDLRLWPGPVPSLRAGPEASVGGKAPGRLVLRDDPHTNERWTGPVHHDLPPQLPAAPVRSAAADDASVGASGESVAAEFALLFLGDAAAAERDVLAALESGAAPVSLVRNFSYAEARKLEEVLLAASRPARAGGSRHEAAVHPSVHPRHTAADDLIRRLADRVRSREQRPADRDVSSGPLFTRHMPAPSYEQQLALSSGGAAYTLSVRASALPELLEDLYEHGAGRTALLWLHEQGGAGQEQAGVLRAWAQQQALVSQSIAALQSRDDDPIVLLPVMISVDAGR